MTVKSGKDGREYSRQRENRAMQGCFGLRIEILEEVVNDGLPCILRIREPSESLYWASIRANRKLPGREDS